MFGKRADTWTRCKTEMEIDGFLFFQPLFKKIVSIYALAINLNLDDKLKGHLHTVVVNVKGVKSQQVLTDSRV